MGLHMKRNISNRARRLSQKLGISYTLVETILREDNKLLRKDLEEGKRVVIDGLTSITPYKSSVTGEIAVRGRVSSALRDHLASLSAPASLEVYTPDASDPRQDDSGYDPNDYEDEDIPDDETAEEEEPEQGAV